jgi:hypothetical protein
MGGACRPHISKTLFTNLLQLVLTYVSVTGILLDRASIIEVRLPKGRFPGAIFDPVSLWVGVDLEEPTPLSRGQLCTPRTGRFCR